jgi:heme-degrading monooxygenase HmoA
MYARLVRFSVGPGQQGVAQAIAGELAPQISSQPGCGGVTVFGDDSDGEYGIFVLWDSQAHAAAAASIIRPILDKHLSGKVQAPPEARLYEVISGSPARPAS